MTINLLYQYIVKTLKTKAGIDKDQLFVLKVAPSGTAAYLLKGNTIHSALRILPSRKLSYAPLSSDAKGTFRKEMIGVNFIIIDEVSMVGCTMLNMIHKRLQEVKGSSKLFGGIQPIFVGDMFQLRPVKDSGWIFETEKSNYGPLAINLWVNNIRMFELTEIMRQGDDKQFAELLNRVREGNQTIDDETIFESRFIKPNEDIDPYLPHLFTVNKSVAKHNKVCYDKMNTEKRKIVAFDDIKGGDMNDELREKLLSKISPDPRNTSRLIKELELAIDLSSKLF